MSSTEELVKKILGKEETKTQAEQGEPKPVEQKEVGEAKTKWDFSEDDSVPAKEVYLVYGDKGEGKTTLALAAPGVKAVITFDHKTTLVKQNFYRGDPSIRVFDGIRYMDYSTPKTLLESANKSYHYILALLEYIGERVKPDWVVFDNLEELHSICEFVMRHRHGLEPFQGIREFVLWKERKEYLRAVFKKAYDVAKRGIIFTTYTDKDEVVIKGELVTRKDVPKWIGIVITETDYVVKVEKMPGERRFYARIDTSKNDSKHRTGDSVDITDNPARFWGGGR